MRGHDGQDKVISRMMTCRSTVSRLWLVRGSYEPKLDNELLIWYGTQAMFLRCIGAAVVAVRWYMVPVNGGSAQARGYTCL